MTDVNKPVYRITDLNETERPRERLSAQGPQALSSAELLGHPAACGCARRERRGNGTAAPVRFSRPGRTAPRPVRRTDNQHGIGEAKAAQIKAAIELGRRLSLESPEERPTINSPADAAALVQYEMSALEQEHLRVLLLDTRNHVLDIVEVYQGSVNMSQIRVGEVFKAAIRRNASGVIVVHNHPSGDPTPSPDDLAVTRALVQAGKLWMWNARPPHHRPGPVHIHEGTRPGVCLILMYGDLGPGSAPPAAVFDLQDGNGAG